MSKPSNDCIMTGELRFVSDGSTSWLTIDGREINGVNYFQLSHRAGELPQLVLEADIVEDAYIHAIAQMARPQSEITRDDWLFEPRFARKDLVCIGLGSAIGAVIGNVIGNVIVRML